MLKLPTNQGFDVYCIPTGSDVANSDYIRGQKIKSCGSLGSAISYFTEMPDDIRSTVWIQFHDGTLTNEQIVSIYENQDPYADFVEIG